LPHTLVEKILLAHCDADDLRPGEVVTVRCDVVMANDVSGPVAFRAMNSSHAGMISAGLRPRSCMSAKVTAPAAPSSRLLRSSIFSGLSATSTGSPAPTPSRMNGRAPARKESSPA
jgi:aconitase B